MSSVTLKSESVAAGLRPWTPSIPLLRPALRGGTRRFLSQIENGRIEFTDGDGHEMFGTDSPDGLTADLHVRDSEFYSQLLWDGSLGFAEAYLQEHWRTNDLTSLLRILCRNLEHLSTSSWLTSAVLPRFRRLSSLWKSNTRNASRRQIAAHYDLSNEFFELFLDPTLMYSSAWFDSETTTLHEASKIKLDRLCRKLDLQSSDHVLEIGTGWGGFALHAVQNHGCQLTTTTISQAQFNKAQERFHEAGVSEQIELLDTDYRDLDGTYDKLVSIEMVEAVGERHLDEYFQCCARLLKPGGRMVIQAIVMPESRFAQYRRGTDFIQRYIFPGGFLPSISAIQESTGRTSSLRLHSVDDMSPHYARTLLEWRKNFLCRLQEVRELGFDDRFIRMWEYYLCYCEAAFREQAVRVVQMVWDKPVYS